MALIATLAHLCVILMLAGLAIAFGTRLLWRLGISAGSALEEALYAAGLFFVALQVLLFVLALLVAPECCAGPARWGGTSSREGLVTGGQTC
jgi:hypothetical protein